jgi:16S rRNA G527 N7-methylase RsmG
LDQRVKVVRSRLEEFHARGSVDVFTCRALASVAKLVTMMGPLLEEAPLLAIKGGRAEEEIVAARDTLREHGLEARTFHVEHFGTVVEIHRESISQIVR